MSACSTLEQDPSPALSDNQLGGHNITERKGNSGFLCDFRRKCTGNRGRAKGGAVSYLHGCVGTVSGWPTLASPSSQTLALETSGEDSEGLAEAVLCAAGRGVADLWERWHLPGKPALQHRAAATPGVIRSPA